MNIIGKNVLITGGTGFLGTHLTNKLRDVCNLTSIGSEHDLRNAQSVNKLLNDVKPHIIIHLASKVGGIGANRKSPGTFFYDNITMGINIIHESMLIGVEKLVMIGTICSYPKFTKVPFDENDLWLGYPEETNAAYGIAKKSLITQCQAYKTEYGLNSSNILLVNLYGPGDNFDPESSHVIPALIKKISHAKEHNINNVEIWGDGTPTREFLHVRDAVDAVIRVTELYNNPDPINIGSGIEISIKDLAYKIRDIIGWDGEFIFNDSMPGGQPRRCLNISRAISEVGFQPSVTFDDGLKETISWWCNQ